MCPSLTSQKGLLLYVGILCVGFGQNYCLRFYGNGTGDMDRVKVPIDAPPNKVDVGGDFTIEFQMRAQAAQNPLGASAITGANDDWTLGHVIIDRDIFGSGDHGDYGISLANGRIAFGVNNGSQSYTLISSVSVADDTWHHIAVTRSGATGTLQIFIDGVLNVSQATPVTGNVSYRDGRATSWPNDPFLVLGAEKHDYDNTQYPSYSGYLDELRISNTVRYTANYNPVSRFSDDANTMLLYHFDEGAGTLVRDSALIAGPPTDGQVQHGGSPQGPIWVLRDNPLTYAPAPSSSKRSCSSLLYPNPCDEWVQLCLPPSDSEAWLRLFSFEGMLLQEVPVVPAQPRMLSLSGYASGWYVLRVDFPDGTFETIALYKR